MPPLIAIDPSPTNTAIVVMDREGVVEASTTLPVMLALDWLQNYLDRCSSDVDKIILEKPPIAPGPQSATSQQTIAAYWIFHWCIEDWCASDTLVSMGPGAWKSAAKGWKIDNKDLGTIHERDAWKMGMVFLARRKQGRKGTS